VSKEKKAKKTRTPNVPMYTGPVQPESAGGGTDTVTARPAKVSARPVAAPAATTSARAMSRTEGITADYTHIVSDLRRIGILAGAMLVVLIVLSFIIK
jgi:hypothetical protein